MTERFITPNYFVSVEDGEWTLMFDTYIVLGDKPAQQTQRIHFKSEETLLEWRREHLLVQEVQS